MRHHTEIHGPDVVVAFDGQVLQPTTASVGAEAISSRYAG
jgi:hypothetical protein